MTVRADVAELLHAGYGDRTIARRLGVTAASVTAARATLGLPPGRAGHKPAGSPEDLFWRRTKPVDGGHLEWTGHRTNKGVAAIKWQGTAYTAGRIAYRIRYGEDPVGHTHAPCGYDGCVAPAHVEDSKVVTRKGRPGAGRKANADRGQIVALLLDGHTDDAIRRELRVDAKRIAVIRREEDIARAPRPVVTFAEKWAAHTVPADGGHVAWTGRRRENTPSLVYRGREYSARRAAFEEHYGREPVGNVLPGCGWEPCVRPDHLEDRTIRQALSTQLASIFGTGAAA
ncbi:hypothetical protein ACIQ6R_16285 [Streptomyces sp. NPDC096048]|uniref:hypothetical protein n=1 Tax=Streptomyces sp. NPDC096048 TaxID=3366072 RepID=UPI0038162E2C